MITIACLRPLKAIRQKNGAVAILDRSSIDKYQKSGGLFGVLDQKEYQWLIDRYGNADIFDLPCGHCLNCKLDYAKTWSQRCLLEAKSWSENWFLTLTYDDDQLPIVANQITGDDIATLVPKDVQDFLKRLREYYKREYNHTPIRFYLAGEYGDRTFRPHYHLICFNLPIPDLIFWSKSPLGDVYFNSELISRLWSHGHVVIGEVTAQSAAYTARYCLKKAKDDKESYDELGIEREFVRMSRRPGIAADYLEKNLIEIYCDDKIYLPNGQTCTPMRYFDDRAAKLGLDIDLVKKSRQQAAALISNERVDLVGKEYYTYLDDLEDLHLKKSLSLVRKL